MEFWCCANWWNSSEAGVIRTRRGRGGGRVWNNTKKSNRGIFICPSPLKTTYHLSLLSIILFLLFVPNKAPPPVFLSHKLIPSWTEHRGRRQRGIVRARDDRILKLLGEQCYSIEVVWNEPHYCSRGSNWKHYCSHSQSSDTEDGLYFQSQSPFWLKERPPGVCAWASVCVRADVAADQGCVAFVCAPVL